MDLSAVGAASIDMHMAQTMQAVDIAMAKQIMDLQEAQGAALGEMMQSAAPSFGHLLDIRV